MKGRVLWDYIEEQARKKLSVDSSWELRAVEIIDNEIAEARLRHDFSRRTETCLVVYTQKEE